MNDDEIRIEMDTILKENRIEILFFAYLLTEYKKYYFSYRVDSNILKYLIDTQSFERFSYLLTTQYNHQNFNSFKDFKKNINKVKTELINSHQFNVTDNIKSNKRLIILLINIVSRDKNIDQLRDYYLDPYFYFYFIVVGTRYNTSQLKDDIQHAMYIIRSIDTSKKSIKYLIPDKGFSTWLLSYIRKKIPITSRRVFPSIYEIDLIYSLLDFHEYLLFIKEVDDQISYSNIKNAWRQKKCRDKDKAKIKRNISLNKRTNNMLKRLADADGKSTTMYLERLIEIEYAHKFDKPK